MITRNLPNQIEVILYARFSPRPNAKECESCTQQLKELRAYCSKRGYKIVGEFHDDALSGTDEWTDRPGMLKAEGASKRGMLFIVRAYDRLFRDVEKGLNFAGLLHGKGVKVRSITEPAASLDTPLGKLIMTWFLAMADYQRELSNARTKLRMLEHQRNGRRMSHLAPYGQMVDPGNPRRLITNTNELAVIMTIVELYSEGMSYRQIANTLTGRGITPRTPPWRHPLIKAILERQGRLPSVEG